jgi:hypothetical protein
MKTAKTNEEFIAYMYKIYPKDHQLPEREGMLKAYDFLTGKYDYDEIERKKIYDLIGEQMKAKGFIPRELTEGEKLWKEHKIGDEYQMDGKPDKWKIAYYPILEDGKTNEKYNEPRALVEKPIVGGTDFREIPLRYLTKFIK